MAFLAEVVTGLKWFGAEVEKAVDFVPKIIEITDDVEADAATLLPEAVSVFTDVENLALAAIKDGGQVVSSAQVLALAITEAYTAKLLNISQDEAVVAAFEGFVKEVTATATWIDVLAAISTLVTDWDKFGASSKAAVAKLESDV